MDAYIDLFNDATKVNVEVGDSIRKASELVVITVPDPIPTHRIISLFLRPTRTLIGPQPNRPPGERRSLSTVLPVRSPRLALVIPSPAYPDRFCRFFRLFDEISRVRSLFLVKR
ncbi:hypothetical protein B296_00043018 [Ensete ventricosum]|uniref:Uncharacterized protein n=1 Tax=Ensete ventricosum TaxID=4639 RepID=A0A426YU72_ENSVE|nr:hypothetical protein B296_00043018 [Ensete ventricosum]